MLFLVTSYLKVVVVLLPLASVETIDIVLVPMFVGVPLIVLFVLSNVSPMAIQSLYSSPHFHCYLA